MDVPRSTGRGKSTVLVSGGEVRRTEYRTIDDSKVFFVEVVTQFSHIVFGTIICLRSDSGYSPYSVRQLEVVGFKHIRFSCLNSSLLLISKVVTEHYIKVVNIFECLLVGQLLTSIEVYIVTIHIYYMAYSFTVTVIHISKFRQSS